MSERWIISRGDQVDAEALNAFLEKSYGLTKGRFLQAHGSWWYRGLDNCLVVVSGGRIAAYCALIPADFMIFDQVQSGYWWVDLMVAPPFRHRGIQSRLDRYLIDRRTLLLGFPNEIAAPIHRRHGWGVREDGRMLMAPLIPDQIPGLKRFTGLAGRIGRMAVNWLSPAVVHWNRRFARYRPVMTKPAAPVDADRVALVFARYRRFYPLTTRRDVDDIRHRYLKAPYRNELRLYAAGRGGCPSHVLIARRLIRNGGPVMRILDLIGDLEDRRGMADIVRTVLKDAVRQGVCQVTIMVWYPALAALLRRIGFRLSAPCRFCWYHPSPSLRRAMGTQRPYLSLADSDNDDPG